MKTFNFKETLKSIVSILFLALALFVLFIFAVRGQTKETQEEIAASGGTFTLEKTVVAGGGSAMQQQAISQNGTTGQTVAGSQSSGGNFTVRSGFWTPDDFTPTAATAIISGRVKAADGRGIRNAVVTITYPNGATQTALSSSFGYYSFAEIPVGETYVVSVSTKRFSFNQPAQVINLIDDATDVDFTAEAAVLNNQQQP